LQQRGTLALDEQLGRILVEGAFIEQAQLQKALDTARSTGRRLRDILIEQGAIDAQTFTTVLSVHFRVPIVDLQNVKVDPEAVKLVPENIAREQNVMPLSIEGDFLKVAMEEPQNVEILNMLATVSGKRIKPVMPLKGGIKEMISANYKLGSRIAEEFRQMMPEQEPARRGAPAAPLISPETVAQTPVVRALDMIITQAIKERASDIHIEPLEEAVRIRYRIDGVLQEAATLPKGTHSALVSRIKVMSGMDIAERRRPQDGQFSMKVESRDVDFRVASVETSQGEVVAIRILDKTLSLVSLADLGFQPSVLPIFDGLLHSPYGMIMVSGPTSSGKTTTLYSSIATLDAQHLNIMTIEDPVEYRFKGINQVQVNAAAGITFAAGLRALMRHDPNVILVGEIRDRETAEVAVQAALTGHLVLTTIHANDSAGAVVRLIDLGVEPFLVTSGLIGSVAQRLVRKVCPYCKSITRVSPSEAAAYQNELGEVRSDFFVGRGCNMCSRTGFLGRLGVFEVLTVNDDIRSHINRGATAQEIREAAVRSGMITLRRDGMMKARDGITTPAEVVRKVFTLI
jgi:type II secretory ATPase GspE/PulE/Tfp pilus assembly ATPase PilB-like protein